jgi:hypothetical protein
MEFMPELIAFCLQVPFIVRVGIYFYGNIVNYLQSVSNKANTFFRVVGDQADFANAQVP